MRLIHRHKAGDRVDSKPHKPATQVVHSE